MALLIFDMDGTIVDSMRFLTERAVLLISRTYGMSMAEATYDYQKSMGMPFRDQLETFRPADPRNDAVASEYENVHRDACATFPLAPGIFEVLQQARQMGHLLMLVTSTQHDFIPLVTALRSLPFRECLGKTRTEGKFENIQKLISGYRGRSVGRFPNRVYYFGDADYDRQCALHLEIAFRRVAISTCAHIVGTVLRDMEAL